MQCSVNPLFVYNFHRCVGNNHEIVQACGGVCGVCGGGVESGGDGLEGREIATTNEGIGWFNEGKNLNK